MHLGWQRAFLLFFSLGPVSPSFPIRFPVDLKLNIRRVFAAILFKRLVNLPLTSESVGAVMCLWTGAAARSRGVDLMKFKKWNAMRKWTE